MGSLAMYEYLDEIDYEELEAMNQDYEMEYRIQDHILENKRLMEYIKYLSTKEGASEI